MKTPHALLLLGATLLLAGTALGADRASAEKALKEAVRKADSPAIAEAVKDLVQCAGKEALAPILALLPKAEGPVYWQLVSGAAGFKDEPALEDLGKFIVARQNDKGSSSADLLFVLGTNGAAATTKPLVHVLEKGRFDLQLMAVDALAVLRTADGLAALEAALKREKGDSDLKRRLESALSTAKSEAPGKVRDHEFAQTKEKGQESHVLVLSADRHGAGDDERDNDFDRIQSILERQKIAHKVVKKYEFEKDPKKYLKDCRALLVNCNRINEYCACMKCAEQPKKGETANRLLAGCNPDCTIHKVVTYKLSAAALAAVKAWVESEGGFLYTEDWGILDVLGPAWPDKVVSRIDEGNAKPRLIRQRTKDGKRWELHFDVHLRPNRGSAAHPLMRGVWQRAAAEKAGEKPAEGTTTEKPVVPGQVFEHNWQIDDEAPAITVLDKAGVTVLLESDDLAKLASGEGAVAITFRPGVKSNKQATDGGARGGTGEFAKTKSGRVLHTISHFGHQDTSTDGQALENLLVNFLLEASKQHDAGR